MNVNEMQSFVDGLPFPVVVIGGDEKIKAKNCEARQLLAQDGLGRHYITGLRQPGVLDAVEACFKTRETQRCRYLGHESGRDTTWQVSVASVVLDKQRGAILSFEDVTAVEEAGQMRRDFVANVSHELRTPLTALVGFIETLKGPARDDAQARDRFLGIMENEAGRMARLVDDLLSLSKVEEEERVRPMDNVEIAGLIQSVGDLLTPLAQKSDLTLDVQTPVEDIEIRGQDEQLRQVMTNLIENAIKYGASGGKVQVRLSGPQPEPALRTEGVRISVRDFGEGIMPHQIARLTERFYRIDDHRSREVGGTGLGLAIVKHIVSRHRGRLRIESVLGEGTCFTVVLPLS